MSGPLPTPDLNRTTRRLTRDPLHIDSKLADQIFSASLIAAIPGVAAQQLLKSPLKNRRIPSDEHGHGMGVNHGIES
jgi:hypothetical protein